MFPKWHKQKLCQLLWFISERCLSSKHYHDLITQIHSCLKQVRASMWFSYRMSWRCLVQRKLFFITSFCKIAPCASDSTDRTTNYSFFVAWRRVLAIETHMNDHPSIDGNRHRQQCFRTIISFTIHKSLIDVVVRAWCVVINIVMTLQLNMTRHTTIVML